MLPTSPCSAYRTLSAPFPRRPASGVLALLVLLSVGRSEGEEIPFAVSDIHALEGLRRAAVGDLDGDGDPDVAAVAPASDRALWLENQDGTWAARLVHPIAQPLVGAHDIAIGDLDRDGDLDLVTTARGAGTVDAWWNPGGATGWTREEIAGSAPGARGVAIGDVDADGDLDVVAAVLGADDLRWWEQTGVGWTGRVLEGTSGGVRELALGDVDEDGDLDVVGVAVTDGEVAWWENPRPGVGVPWTRHAIESVAEPAGLAVVDFDRDSDLDVLVARGTDDAVLLLANDGPGSRMSWSTGVVGSAGAVGDPVGLAPVDLDVDGDLDLVVASASGAGAWLERVDDDLFVSRVVATGAPLPLLLPADFDRDGDPDLVAVETDAVAAERLRLFDSRRVSRTGDFHVSDQLIDAFAEPTFVPPRFGDIDGDGDLDLVLLQVVQEGLVTGLSWYENRHEAEEAGFGYLIRHDILPGTIDLRFPQGFDVGDMDGDGDVDVLVGEATQLDRFVRFCDNLDGRGGAWNCSTRLPSDGSGDWDVDRDLVIGDVDGDGDLDFVTPTGSLSNPGGEGRDGVFFFENLGDMSQVNAFEAHLIAEVFLAFDLRLGDMDGDGDLDVVLNNETLGDMEIWTNDAGDGTSWSRTSPFGSTEFELGDIDLDADLDIVIRGSWLEQDGGVFTQRTIGGVRDLFPDIPPIEDGTLTTGPPTLADLDGDGDIDVLATWDYRPHGGDLELGFVHWWENRTRENAPQAREIDEDWVGRTTDVAAAVNDPLHLLDVDGDARLDLGILWNGSIERAENSGAALEIDVELVAPAVLVEGEEAALVAVQLRHEGRGADPDLEVTEIRVRLGEAPNGTPALDATQLDALVETIALRSDDGNGVFGPEDPVVAAWASATLDGEEIVLSPPAGSEPAWDRGETGRLFVTLEPAGGAAAALTETLRVSVPRLPVAARTQDNLFPVSTGAADPDAGAAFDVEEGGVSEDPLFADGFESGDTTAWL